MAISDFFNAIERVTIGNQELGFMKVDTTVSENHSIESFISSNQIEDGSNIADHYKRRPDKLSLECIISDVSPTIRTGLKNIVSVGGSKIGSSIGSRVGNLGSVVGSGGAGVLGSNLLTNGDNKAADAFRKLNEFVDKAALLSVSTQLKTYDSMMISSVTFPKNATLGKALKFNISFERVRVANSRDIPIPESVVNGNTAHSATSKTDLGKQKLQTPEPTKQARGSSLAFKLFGL